MYCHNNAISHGIFSVSLRTLLFFSETQFLFLFVCLIDVRKMIAPDSYFTDLYFSQVIYCAGSFTVLFPESNEKSYLD